MTEVHVYRQPCKSRYVKKNGEVTYHRQSRTCVYVCKLHHPDAAEMAVIRAELDAGMTKVEAARRFGIGTDKRLRRLLRKWPAETQRGEGAQASARPRRASHELSNADVCSILAEAGFVLD